MQILISMKVCTSSLKAIDFFCGGGGMTYGLRQSGIDVIAGVDFAEECKDTYEQNNPTSTFINSDIRELKENYFEENFSIKRNDDNLIFVGCSPCQYYSIINTDRKKSKDTKDLLREFMRFVDYYNPGYILVENVPGILTRTDSVFPLFEDFLKKKKYFYKYEIVNMCYYGVPQTRKRFSLIASRLGDVYMPKPDQTKAVLSEFIGLENGFPSIEAGHKDVTDFMHTASSLAPINIKRLINTPLNGGSRLAWKDNPALQLRCYIGKDHSFTDVYGRLRWDKPSSTITTNFVKITSGRFAHPIENRGLSIREGATLQTFPKDYKFCANSILANARIIGNAVPPEYARRLGILLYELKEKENGTI